MNARLWFFIGCLSFVARAELPENSKWSWSVVSGGGASGRVMLFIEASPPSRAAREWWTVETAARNADGKTPVTLTVRNAKGTSKSNFLSWEENGVTLLDGKPLVTRTQPPHVLSMERVPCSSPLLFNLPAMCSGRVGGPLQQPELPFTVYVSYDEGQFSDALTTLAMGILTGGVLIPGRNDKSVIATMNAAPTVTLDKSLQSWRKSARTPAVLAKIPGEFDGETAGAFWVLADSSSVELLEALMRRAPEEDRWSLIRLARATKVDDVGVVRVVARLSDSLRTDDEALRSSALHELSPVFVRGVAGILNGSMPELGNVARSDDVEAASLRSLQNATVVEGEGIALAMLLSKTSRSKHLPTFIERLSDEEGFAVVESVANEATLQKIPGWVDRQMANGRGKSVLELLSFDDARMKLLNGVLSRVAEKDRADVLMTGFRSISGDAARLKLLSKKNATTLSVSQRIEAMKILRATETRAEAAKLLLDGLEGDERIDVQLAWILSSNGPTAVALLKSELKSLDVVRARRVFESYTFDSDKANVAPALLALVPEDARAELFVDFMKKMTFDDGRLELLRQPVPKLTDAQRNRALDSFRFQRGKGEALLK